jgi:5-methylcytosine-specific restriction endonuclease McrA
MAKTCSIEGCNYPCWSKGLCKSHAPKKPLKKSFKPVNKITERQKEKNVIKKELTIQQFEMFKEIYKEHPTKRCYECNCKVDGASSVQFHHILFKSAYPQYRLEKWNIVLLCETHHNQVHTDVTKTPKVNALTKEIKEKHGIN